jgi:hypothetical protein
MAKNTLRPLSNGREGALESEIIYQCLTPQGGTELSTPDFLSGEGACL